MYSISTHYVYFCLFCSQQIPLYRGYGSHGQYGRHAFRKWFAHIQEIRSLLPSQTPIMTLTATAVKKTRNVILKTLGITKPIIITTSPNRKNISYAVKLLDKNRPIITYFQWLVNALKEHKKQAKRIIIYCQTINQCHKLYSVILDILGDSVYANPMNKKQKLVEMLHSNTPARVKDEIIESMTTVGGYVRVLLCTIAFGMGINCKTVDTVIHLGPSKNVESYVQESGRCGRDGQQSNAIIYYLGRMLTHVDESMKGYVSLHTDGITCRRKYLLNYFDISKEEMDMALSYNMQHNCCDICAKACSCEEVSCPTNVLPEATTGFDLGRTREVTAKQKQELNKKLVMLRKELNIPLFEKFIGYSGKIHTAELPIFLNQFSTFQINQILSGAHSLFSINDIVSHVEIWKRDHALQVYKTLHDVFNDMDPIPDNFLPSQKENDDEESDEDEWDDFMNDTTCFEDLSITHMDMSSFDFEEGMDLDDAEIHPQSVEEALQLMLN